MIISMRRLAIAALLTTALSLDMGPACAADSALIPQTAAARHGLKRPWFNRLAMDAGRSRLNAVVLQDGILYMQSDRAMLHAVDAETGQTLWAKRVGRADHPSMTPGVNSDFVAVVNGSRLYVCNRYNGDLLYETEVEGAPGAGAALSQKRAYIPMVDGMVMAYRLESLTDPAEELGIFDDLSPEESEATAEEERRENLRLNLEYISPLACKSFGQTLVQPIIARETVGEEFVVWPTDRGHLNIGHIDRTKEGRFSVKYRLETQAAIIARPTYLPPDPNIEGDSGLIFGASKDGFVHAIREKNGEPLWRFSAGEPIVERVVVVDQRVFAPTQLGGLFCIDTQSGKELWWAPKITQFVAASKQRVYATDRVGLIHVLNIETGAHLDTIDASRLPVKMVNTENDRIYLASETGLVQCLHEIELTVPLVHAEDRKFGKKRETVQEGIGDLNLQPDPAGQDAPPVGDAGDDPFDDAGQNPLDQGGGKDVPPAGDGAEQDDPFDDAGNPFDNAADPFADIPPQ